MTRQQQAQAHWLVSGVARYIQHGAAGEGHTYNRSERPWYAHTLHSADRSKVGLLSKGNNPDHVQAGRLVLSMGASCDVGPTPERIRL